MKPYILLILIILCLPVLNHCNAPQDTELYNLKLKTLESKSIQNTKPYEVVKAEILAERNKYQSQYELASEDDKKRVLKTAGHYLDSTVCDILFPYWKGTKWDFNGHTDIPNEGEIACGYLVSTILKHAGLNINRYKMAQQSALNEIKTISGASGATYLGGDYETALDKIKQLKDGLYILGLSNHVGFIRVAKNDVRFIHSTYLEPTAAVNEKASESDAFKYSSAYYIGEISNNPEFIRKWISGEKVNVILD